MKQLPFGWIQRHYMNLCQTPEIKLGAELTCSLLFIHVGECIGVDMDRNWGSNAVGTPCCWQAPSIADDPLFKDEQTEKKNQYEACKNSAALGTKTVVLFKKKS